MTTPSPATTPTRPEGETRFAAINPIHAVPLAQAFESARNWDELYACLRFHRKQTDCAVDLSGYLYGYHFEGVDHADDDFARVQDEASEWLDARFNRDVPKSAGPRFS